MVTHALFETASGYAIFNVNFKEDIGSRSTAVQDSIDDLPKFGKMVTLASFSPFKSAAHALENANDVSEGQSPSFYSLRLSTSQISRSPAECAIEDPNLLNLPLE